MLTSRCTVTLSVAALLTVSACGLSHHGRGREDRDTTDTGHDPSQVQPPSAPDGASDEEQEDDDALPPEPAPDDIVWTFARDNEELSIVGIDLSNGTLVTPSAAPLPHPASSLVRAESWGPHIVLFEHADRSKTLEARGATWSVLSRAEKGTGLSVQMVADLSVAWVSVASPAGTQTIEVLALASDGEGDEPTIEATPTLSWRAPDADPPRLLAFGEAGLFYQRGLEVMLQSRDPSQPAARVTTVSPQSPGIGLTFATSFILYDSWETMRWLTLAGVEIHPQGFDPNGNNLHQDVQVVGDELYRLSDRKVTFVQKVGSLAAFDDLVPVTHGEQPMALLRTRVRWRLVDASGKEVAAYQPENVADQCGLWPAETRDSSATWPDRPAHESAEFVALFRVDHHCTSGDQLENGGQSLDVWRFDPRTGASSVKRLRTVGPETWLSHRMSPSGRYAVAVVAGKLERIDTYSGEATQIDVGLTLLDWLVR
jgi:hypothetical protein